MRHTAWMWVLIDHKRWALEEPMKYTDGTLAKLGDKILVWEGNEGVVVCSMDTDEYSEEYPKEAFGYLERGIMVLSEKAGLIHYVKPEEGMRLIEGKR
ncbi:hypothetical protein LB535_10585 [Mesorhizobium sp. CA10]|uniref:hypothetical protein n=1 Tax=Mesorhizobium sp. CA10 TaxID=588495 RepID=UPI001CC9021C|nr:hypothetical protein [Mesorhizobium sp. CA10]MBZ9882801.1 hypothetical protein [Mesorhizobium sp. CA10]